jgi:hypothetical protein
MTLIIIIISAFAVGILGGWIYAGFPGLRRGTSSPRTETPRAIREAGLFAVPRRSSPRPPRRWDRRLTRSAGRDSEREEAIRAGQESRR